MQPIAYLQPHWTGCAVRLLAIGVALTLAGCAQVNPRPDYARVARQAEEIVGVQPPASPEPPAGLAERTREALADGLRASQAVELALQNSPSVRAALLRVGIARADLVQAGLFTNPSLGLSLQLPEGGGLANFQASFAQNIADLWQIPARKSIAQHDLEQAILEAAQVVADVAHDTRSAYWNVVAARRSYELAQDSVGLAQQLADVAQIRLEAGATSALDTNLARGQTLRARVDEHAARLAHDTARRTLATLLGAPASASELRLLDDLPAPMTTTLDAERLVTIASESRLDLQTAQEVVGAAKARISLERARVFPVVEIGLDLEREARRAQPGRMLAGDTARASLTAGKLTPPEYESRAARRKEDSTEIGLILGPSISLTLPLFDQNQAQIARAEFSLREAEALLENLSRSAETQTRQAAERLQSAWLVARLYEQEALPQAETTLALSQAAYEAGQTPILNLIDARRTLVETRLAYVAALHDATLALIELERATGRPASLLLAQTPLRGE